MSKAGAVMRLLVFAVFIVIAIASTQRASCPPHRPAAQTASVGGVLAQADWYDGSADPSEYYDDEEYIDDEWCPPEISYDTFYVDEPYYEIWDYSYDSPYPVPYSYTSYYAPSSPTPYTYTSVVPLGSPVGPQPIPTVTTASVPTQSTTLRFDVVPLGVPTGGAQQSVPQTPPQKPVIHIGAPTQVVPITIPAQLPSCSLSATPAATGYSNIVFQWNSSGAVSAILSDVGIVPLQSSGYTVSAPIGSRIYTLAVQDAYGRSAQCSTYVQVLTAPPISYQKPWCSIAGYPASVYAGEAVTLSWASTNATGATLTDAGAVGTIGSYSVSPGASRSYTLTVYGPGGSAMCNTYVSVSKRPTPTPAGPKAPTCSLTADPASIFPGVSATLRWTSMRADSATLTDIGAVATSGSAAVSPSASREYTLTVKGAGGSSSCKVAVSVESTSSCTITCNGITYECAPVGTPVGVQCPSQGTSRGGFWSWLSDLLN